MPEAIATVELTSLLVMGAGLYHLGFAVFHLFFARLFRWETQLAKLHPVNRGVMQAMNVFLTVALALFAYLLLRYPELLLTEQTGRMLLFGIGLTWFVRAAIHPKLFGLRHPGSVLVNVLCVVAVGLCWIPLAIS